MSFEFSAAANGTDDKADVDSRSVYVGNVSSMCTW